MSPRHFWRSSSASLCEGPRTAPIVDGGFGFDQCRADQSCGMVRKRHPTIADAMIVGIDRDPAPCFQSVRNCEHALAEAGMAIPSWVEMAATPPSAAADPEPTGPKYGRQQQASKQLQEKFHLDVVWPSLSESERAMLRSQHGPLASGAMTGRRGFALECVAAQVCREAGARVATNVFARDLDLGEFNGLDSRRLEVIADGLPLWRGAHLATDTTLLSTVMALQSDRLLLTMVLLWRPHEEGTSVPRALR